MQVRRDLDGVEDVHTRDDCDFTAIHNAAGDGHLLTLKFLIEDLGVDVDQEGFDGMTALHLAVNNLEFGAVKYLVARGADLSITAHVPSALLTTPLLILPTSIVSS